MRFDESWFWCGEEGAITFEPQGRNVEILGIAWN